MGKALNVSRWVLPAIAVAVTAAVGCGVSDVTDGMFSNGGDPGGTGGSTTTTTTTTTTGTVNPTTTTSSGGGQGQGGAGGGGTGGMSGTGGSGGTPPVGFTLPCGDAPDCDVPPSSACCWFKYQAGMDACISGAPDPATCNTANTDGGRGSRIECQLPSNCQNGQVCCGTFVQGGGVSYYSEVTCRDQCNGVTLCDPANPVCPPTSPNCLQSGSLPDGYFICRP